MNKTHLFSIVLYAITSLSSFANPKDPADFKIVPKTAVIELNLSSCGHTLSKLDEQHDYLQCFFGNGPARARIFSGLGVKTPKGIKFQCKGTNYIFQAWPSHQHKDIELRIYLDRLNGNPEQNNVEELRECFTQSEKQPKELNKISLKIRYIIDQAI